MNRQSVRRRVKKRKAPKQKTRVKFTAFLGIMVLAVLAGYLTARFVVGPFIGYDADESPAKIAEALDGQKENQDSEDEDAEESGDSEAQADSSIGKFSDSNGDSGIAESAEGVFQDVPSEGYALQFGVFSTAEGAEQLQKALKEQGIPTEIVKTENLYKVISPVVDTREKVLGELESLEGKQVEDVFVTSFG